MMRRTMLLSALAIGVLFANGETPNVAVAGNLTSTTVNKTGALSVINRAPERIRRQCPSGQVRMQTYVYRSCKAGENPPGGIFGNKCFDIAMVCGFAPVVK